ncbi:MAG: hypothetical protein JW807_10740 [Spirochaetes bacterium]|nr:hypothetical protein [Spirochaetota bacterium]
MPAIDHMKVIGVLSKTIGMEIIDVRPLDKSFDTLEITMGGPARSEKKFLMTVTDSYLSLSFQKKYMPAVAFNKWRSSLEYELEQSLLKNIGIRIIQDASNHIVKIEY